MTHARHTTALASIHEILIMIMSVEIAERENEDRTMVAHPKEFLYHHFDRHFELGRRLATMMHSVCPLFAVSSPCEVSKRK